MHTSYTRTYQSESITIHEVYNMIRHKARSTHVLNKETPTKQICFNKFDAVNINSVD